MSTGYYPDPNDRRADWWTNIITNQGSLTDAGFSTDEKNAVVRDANWAVYCYRTAREAFAATEAAVLAYVDLLTDGPDGAAPPTPPAIPVWPVFPAPAAVVGIEERRVKWVERVRSSPAYNPALGTLLGIEPPASTFDPATYQAEIFGLSSPAARTVSGKFRKARGMIDGINFYGREEGTMPWIFLARFNASPFTAAVPLTGTGPKPWEVPRPRGEARCGARGGEHGGAGDCARIGVLRRADGKSRARCDSQAWS